MKRTKAQTGKLSRTKGANFERLIARMLREKFPGAEVYRSQQADRAHDPDIVIRGASHAIDNFWPELTCGKHATWSTVKAKMSQAFRDIDRAGSDRFPVVIWRRQGSREIWATEMGPATLITYELGEWIALHS